MPWTCPLRFAAAQGFVRKKWGGSRYGAADKDYCDLKFSTSAFKKRGTQGENNMGMKTMELVDFMTKECAWTLLTCTGGNYGLTGSMREQQMVFRNAACLSLRDDSIGQPRCMFK